MTVRANVEVACATADHLARARRCSSNKLGSERRPNSAESRSPTYLRPVPSCSWSTIREHGRFEQAEGPADEEIRRIYLGVQPIRPLGGFSVALNAASQASKTLYPSRRAVPRVVLAGASKPPALSDLGARGVPPVGDRMIYLRGATSAHVDVVGVAYPVSQPRRNAQLTED